MFAFLNIVYLGGKTRNNEFFIIIIINNIFGILHSFYKEGTGKILQNRQNCNRMSIFKNYLQKIFRVIDKPSDVRPMQRI